MISNSTQIHYADGEVIKQHWNIFFIVLAYAISFVASYSAVRLLEQNLWRSKKEQECANSLTATYPKASAAFILGFGTVWSMHFIGQSAVTLDETPVCYNWPLTLISMASVIILMYAGIRVASLDVFAGLDREKKLRQILMNDPIVTSKGRHQEARQRIHKIAYFHKLHKIFAGATLAALGAIVMHYSGMYALNGPFQKQWKEPYVASSVFIGIVVCFVGFWIIFRPLHWKVQQVWLRPASAAVIALAVCGLHFFGMLGVTYVADSSLGDVCAAQWGNNNFFGDWTGHQIVIVTVTYLVPAIGLFVEHSISTETRLAYVELKDVNMKLSFKMSTASRFSTMGCCTSTHTPGEASCSSPNDDDFEAYYDDDDVEVAGNV